MTQACDGCGLLTSKTVRCPLDCGWEKPLCSVCCRIQVKNGMPLGAHMPLLHAALCRKREGKLE